MDRPIVLHQMMASDIAPEDLPAFAADLGCRQVSLFTYAPARGIPDGFAFPLVTARNKTAVLRALADHDIAVSGVEFFPIMADIAVSDFAGPLALGREIGARRAVTLIFDDDRVRALDKLGALVELARASDLALGLEFTPLTRGCTSLHEAVWFVDQLDGELGIGVDALHLVRSGGCAADIKKLDAGYFLYTQICDGHGLHVSADYFDEAHNRETPGRGDFPLREILAALPRSIVLEIEVPADQRRGSGVSARQHVAETIATVRSLVAGLSV